MVIGLCVCVFMCVLSFLSACTWVFILCFFIIGSFHYLFSVLRCITFICLSSIYIFNRLSSSQYGVARVQRLISIYVTFYIVRLNTLNFTCKIWFRLCHNFWFNCFIVGKFLSWIMIDYIHISHIQLHVRMFSK